MILLKTSNQVPVNLCLDKSLKRKLINALSKIKLNKSVGLDKISNKLLKAAGQSICETLLYIFNLILETGIFPEDLKQAKVTPRLITKVIVVTIDQSLSYLLLQKF